MRINDTDLIDAYLKGDDSAFTQIVRRYADAVMSCLGRMCRDRTEAEDFFQETFTRAYRNMNNFKGDNLRPWLLKIAANVAFTGFKKASRFPVLSLSSSSSQYDGDCPAASIAAQTAPAPEQTIKNEQARHVRTALESLPQKQRAVLVLAYYEKMTYSQIAEILGCSLGTVKTNMSRAITSLAPKLARIGGHNQ